MTTEAGAAIAHTLDHGGLARPGRNFRGTFKLGDLALRIIAGLVLFYLFLPILVIIVFSFN
ncbi:MAG: ABC transporter permease, partial [Mycobacterium sp.]|nr:ABC transporter permease [Mycobacterium sp.]